MAQRLLVVKVLFFRREKWRSSLTDAAKYTDIKVKKLFY